MQRLPIDDVLSALLQTLAQYRGAVLRAEPGAGKTTRVPLALLDQSWLAGKRIIMLEPRRLAARAAASYMASALGEPVGRQVGYRVRMDSQVGPETRLEVITEGVLTRMLQDDPALEGVGLVIFDEYHERSLQADLGLALCLDAQQGLREDLKLLVMSATLEGEAVARLLGNVPVITSEGRSYPVDIRYGTRPAPRQLIPTVVAAIVQALQQETGSMLVFLPGAGEIRRVCEQLAQRSLPAAIKVMPLYGDLTREQQDEAIRPAGPGERKVVLATAIAETSLTIEGIRVVVDVGLMRVPRFDPRSGMTRLETLNATQASATQRCGRAGRLEPGVCYRLWSAEEQGRLLEFSRPEILESDLAPLALELAQWGVVEANALQWMDAPPAAAFAQARDLLRRLGALEADGRLSRHGLAMARLGMHPRLAHMLLRGKALGQGALACELAALLEERDILRDQGVDFYHRLEALHGRRYDGVDRGAIARVRQVAEQSKRQLGVHGEVTNFDQAGLLLAFAYPDRIAQHRPGAAPRFLLANGRGALLPAHDGLAAAPWLVAVQLDGNERETRVFLAAEVTQQGLERHFADQIETQDFISWDDRSEAVLARSQRRLGALVLEDVAIGQPDREQLVAGLLAGIRQRGLAVLPWNEETQAWCHRVLLLRQLEVNAGDEQWPDVSEQGLLTHLEQWLAPYVGGMTRLAHLQRIDLKSVLNALLSWPQRQLLEQQAPTHIEVPTGSHVRIDYAADSPVLAVRLQEMFGLADTPSIANGRLPLTLHLLSPARRPIQVTRDLASFWRNTYFEVKKDLKGRYPKHYWPDDPLQAEPTRGIKKR